ncbi:NAD-dependent epimerase/dehydratase family protein [Saccharothrix coeruleofusca]|uniref:NAD-dependent epimerase/dehydratase family protein n=1 Tax=Saccharothrix coeruleofusca TaxID=33919 RepID=UPI001AE2DA9C|nr:NAD-dependent epimerase/dehydratase family protein [Saccharothrix coeruleofusca]MBP2334794.1 nucleoside-diphosphate-sugar epimerase [Saccharothrix coeruleofusca]
MNDFWGEDHGRKTIGKTILVTGGTGFIGGAALRALADSEPGTNIRVLSRQPLPESLRTGEVLHVHGDLTDPSSLRGVCEGVSTVLHLASHVGRDPELCDVVNRHGTTALLADARRHGVSRVAYMSTTAVYGHGVHRGLTETGVNPLPVSPASRSRLFAEQAVRGFGGIVLRPHLVYGVGDVWFIPTLLRLLNRVPSWIQDGAARVSVVCVDMLGEVLSGLTRIPWRGGETYHVSHPRSTSFRSIVRTVCSTLRLDLPSRSLPVAEHREISRGMMPELTDHQHELLASDHWYDSSRIWRKVRQCPGPGFSSRFARAADWYRDLLPIG